MIVSKRISVFEGPRLGVGRSVMTLSSRLEYSRSNEIPLKPEQLVARDQLLARLESGEYETEETPCICRGYRDIVIAEKDRYGLPVRTLLCRNCGLLRSSPRMTMETAAKFYQSEYRALYSGHLTMDSLFEGQVRRGSWIVREMGSLLSRVNTVFEVGCCSGGILLPLKEIGKTVAGCDMDEEYLDFGRRRGLELITGTAKTVGKTRRESADLVILSHVVEHYVCPQEELIDAIQLVRPGGFLVIEVPGVLTLDNNYRDNLLFYLQNAHNYHFTGDTLSSLVRSVGLEVISFDEYITLAARKPEGWMPESRQIEPHAEHAQSVLDYLTRIERKAQVNDSSATNDKQPIQGPNGGEPWPLSTDANLRVMAWPDYRDIESITRILMVSEPLFNNSDACLCLRHDKQVDIPLDEARQNVEHAFDKLSDRGELNILIVDDPIEKADWPRLGRSVTCVLQTDENIEPIRQEFVDALGVEVISGRQ